MTLSFLSIALMAFGSGFSLLFSSQILVTWILDQGGSIDQVGWVSLLTLPYLCSFLWMPIFDYLSLYLKRKYMVSISFSLLSLVLYISSYMDPVAQYERVMLLGLLIALISATNDHIIEAYRLKALKEREYKLGVSLSLMAFRIGIMLAGGIGLVYASMHGWQNTYQFASFTILTLAVSILFSPSTEVVSDAICLQAHISASWQFLMSLLRDSRFISVLLTYRLSVFWLELMMPALLLKLMKLSVYDLGVIYKLYGVMGLLLGGIVVNFIVDQSKIVKALVYTLTAQIGVCGLFFGLSLLNEVPYELTCGVVFIECFLQGVLGTVSTIWLMKKTRSNLPAFSFSVWHGLSALGRVLIGPVAAFVIDDFGWSYYTLLGVLLAMMSVLLARYYAQNYA